MEQETDNIASNLNNLFGSDLFKENNFIKIYNLLGITNIESPAPPSASTPAPTPTPAPEPAPAPAPPPLADAPAEIDNILGKFNYNNNKLFYNIGTDNIEIKIFDDSKNLAEIIKEFINEKKPTFNTEILNSFKAGISIIDNITDTDIIVDPAGLNFMQKNFNGVDGVSKIIYKLLDPIYNNSSPIDVIQHFNQFNNDDDLFKGDVRNAFYNKYNYNDKIIHLIHAIGPNYSSIKLTDIKDEYKKFMVLYNDIFSVYTDNITNDKKLRLPLHSTGLFSGKKTGYPDNMIYILICLALAYLYIYCKINEGNEGTDSKVNIYYIGNDSDINNFKKILTHIIDLIK
jgi:hypothetical protein